MLLAGRPFIGIGYPTRAQGATEGSKIMNYLVGSPGLVVMEGDSCFKVVGSNPFTIFHIYL